MAEITLGGNTVHTVGNLPLVGSIVPDSRLTNPDLTDFKLSDYRGKKVILNIMPSISTGVCAASMRAFNKVASGLENTVVICVSKDLPFAYKHFCGVEGIDAVVCGSEYKEHSFSEAFGVVMTNGAFEGLMSRAVVVLDEKGAVTYAQQVPEIGQEPDYDSALAAVRAV